MRKLFLFALVATMFAACVTDEAQDVAVELAPETLTVSFEESDSRIQLQNGKTVWTKGDLVSVFYRSNANQKWQYQGETGERTGDLKQIAAGSATATMPRVVIVYPYSDRYYLNHETYNIEASLPATQSYVKDSYGVGGNIMVSSGEYNQFALKSVCGWLKLQLTGKGEKVKSIKLKGNNGEQIAGQLYINSTTATATLASEKGSLDDGENSAGGNLVFDNTILTEVTLDCGEGVELGAEPTAFYIGLPPQTFTQGLSLEIESVDGAKTTKSTNKQVVISRNAIQPMAAFEVEIEREIPETWKIYYTATEKVEPYNTDAFGVNILSNKWDSATGEGVIAFDGEVTEIGEDAFKYCSSLTDITIPNSVILIGDSAFFSCSILTSFTIPDFLTSIGKYAFKYCSSLTDITIPNSVTSIGEFAFSACNNLKVFYGKYAADNGRCLIENNTIIAYAEASGTTYMIPNNVTSIGYAAFAVCSSLTSITIPDTIASIGRSAFNGCSSLTSVTIPDSVTSIEYGAFYKCSNLKEVHCNPATPPTGGNIMFDNNASGRKIYVPSASVEAYKAAQYWSDYANYIYAHRDDGLSVPGFGCVDDEFTIY